eukprot:979209-Rhodomonas_salina.1
MCIRDSVQVEVSINFGVDFTNDGVEFVFEAEASVDAVTPSVVIAGVHGQVVTVTGNHFRNSKELSCRFGAKDTVRALYASSSMVSCTIPLLFAGHLTLSVANDGTHRTSQEGRLWVLNSAGTLKIFPSAGPTTGGTAVTVLGSHNLLKIVGQFCFFGNTQAAIQTVSSDTLVCIAPSSLEARSVDFTLEGLERLEDQKLRFRFYTVPAVSSIQPKSGSKYGGTIVQLTGSNFLAEGLHCRIGTEDAPVKYTSSSRIHCSIPASTPRALGPVCVEISQNDGSDFTATCNLFTFEKDPTVTSMRPTVGIADTSGQVVTVLGQHFVETNELS